VFQQSLVDVPGVSPAQGGQEVAETWLCMCRRGGQDRPRDTASLSHQWLDDHTRRLVEDITGLAGVEEVVLTVREDAPARLTADQAR